MTADGFKTYHRHSTVQARQVGSEPERVVTSDGVQTANPGDYILLHDPDGSPSNSVMDADTFAEIYGDSETETPQEDAGKDETSETPQETPSTPAETPAGTPVDTPTDVPAEAVETATDGENHGDADAQPAPGQ